MKLSIKVLIIISVFIVPTVGAVIADNLIETYIFPQQATYSPESANSTVYIENGVSGIVSITDPTLGRSFSFNIDYYPMESGSGIIVSPDGYIITAYHVIGDVQTLKSQQTLKRMSDSDTKLYLERAAVASYLSHSNPSLGAELLYNNPAANFQVTDHNVDLVIDRLSQSNLIKVSSNKQVVKVRLPSSSGTATFVDATIVDVGNASRDEDVALLKIDAHNLPALQINSGKPKIGENLRIYGYPGNNTTEMQYQMNSTLVPSTSAGYLKSQINNPEGISYYETSAQVSEGYSGGPVLDPQNKVLGIVIYSIESQARFKQIFGSQSSVFLSSEYLIQLCNKNHVPILSSG